LLGPKSDHCHLGILASGNMASHAFGLQCDSGAKSSNQKGNVFVNQQGMTSF
jgi:hypothetical protein